MVVVAYAGTCLKSSVLVNLHAHSYQLMVKKAAILCMQHLRLRSHALCSHLSVTEAQVMPQSLIQFLCMRIPSACKLAVSIMWHHQTSRGHITLLSLMTSQSSLR